MFLPFGRFAVDIGCQLGAGSADAGLRILSKRTNVIGQITEPMLLIRLPKPVGGGQSEIAASSFAFAQGRLAALERARTSHQCPKQQGKTDRRAKRAEGEEQRLAPPVRKHSFFRSQDCIDEGKIAQGMDREDAH